ncbi:hypothetical protein M413DRAFT_445902 [Hebeloma cylindrosporum]|uniref:Peptidase S9 prolyl oligopeptidase catalytic domain-containing protein n=1 Tax=Hebeloma cylindrosporum TaxID=76867 RepID=A0A0C3CA23_HEBCY|nr:hypothetical protein M413DRAFT_445902 [Hebeloma cylindrosporum h7]
MSVDKEDHVVGGLKISVYKPSITTASVAVLFLLHGRHGSAAQVDGIARALAEKTSSSTHNRRTILIVTLEHRNHGSRLIDARANNSWTETEDNSRHALDMYAIQTGTARDVSFLIDFLPSYLFPHDESKIDSWGVVGISLGGHSTWIILSQEPRVQVGIPIIGCPDYIELIKHRAKASNIPFTAPYIPSSLLKLIEVSDPASRNHGSLDGSNPFLGKKILILSGEKDTLVPWAASKKFVEGLEVGPDGEKKVILQKGVGHKCTDEMVEQTATFIQAKL